MKTPVAAFAGPLFPGPKTWLDEPARSTVSESPCTSMVAQALTGSAPEAGGSR